MSVVIFHNPGCGTSRNVLQIIERAGYTPQVVEYLLEGWTMPLLNVLFTGAGLTPRDALRVSKSPAEELGLTDPSVSDRRLMNAMLDHPVLVNRPIVVTPKGTKLCRPSEVVLSLLARQPESFTKEDGEVVRPAP